MLCLFDLGHEYWKNWFATQSGVRAYELTLERIEWYVREYPRLVVCCDSPISKRKEIEPTYKANRKEKPREAIDSLTSVEDRLIAWGVKVAKCDGYEADDLIGCLTEQAWPEPVEIICVDKDIACLISETVCLIGNRGRFWAEDCEHKYGVPPSMMTEWLALVGDASDGIRGCDSLGPKRAADLLKRFETIAGIQAASDDDILSVPGVGKKTLACLREWDSTLALKLVRLLDDAPVKLIELLPEGM